MAVVPQPPVDALMFAELSKIGVVARTGTPVACAVLAAAPPGMRKQMLGEKLFPAVAQHQPGFAGKITGMMLEMDNFELLDLLDSESELKSKVDGALHVLEGQLISK